MSAPSEATSFEKYNWDELPKEVVRQGVTRCGFAGEQVLMVMNWLEPGMKVNPHKHPFEQIAYIVKGTAAFHIGDAVVTAGPGDVIRIPADVMHYAEPIGSETVLNLDIFAPIRDDYRHLTAYQQKK